MIWVFSLFFLLLCQCGRKTDLDIVSESSQSIVIKDGYSTIYDKESLHFKSDG